MDNSATNASNDEWHFRGDNYEVYIDEVDHLIHATMWGTWTLPDADNWGRDNKICVDEVRRRGWPVLTLGDLSQLDMKHFTDSKTLKRLSEITQTLDIDQTAIFGMAARVVFTTNLLGYVYPKMRKIKTFMHKEDALKHLTAVRTKLDRARTDSLPV